jgi:hypothetical protein
MKATIYRAASRADLIQLLRKESGRTWTFLDHDYWGELISTDNQCRIVIRSGVNGDAHA